MTPTSPPRGRLHHLALLFRAALLPTARRNKRSRSSPRSARAESACRSTRGEPLQPDPAAAAVINTRANGSGDAKAAPFQGSSERRRLYSRGPCSSAPARGRRLSGFGRPAKRNRSILPARARQAKSPPCALHIDRLTYRIGERLLIDNASAAVPSGARRSRRTQWGRQDDAFPADPRRPCARDRRGHSP